MLDAPDYPLSTLLELTQVAANAAKAACKQEGFLESNVLQHSVASALCKTVEGFDIRMLRGYLSINGEKEKWPETITLVCVGDQWMGQGQIYTQKDLEAMVKQKCVSEVKLKMEGLDKPTLTMEYSIVKGAIGMGMSSPEVIQTVSDAIVVYQSQMEHDLLQSSTIPTEGYINSRRI